MKFAVAYVVFCCLVLSAGSKNAFASDIPILKKEILDFLQKRGDYLASEASFSFADTLVLQELDGASIEVFEVKPKQLAHENMAWLRVNSAGSTRVRRMRFTATVMLDVPFAMSEIEPDTALGITNIVYRKMNVLALPDFYCDTVRSHKSSTRRLGAGDLVLARDCRESDDLREGSTLPVVLSIGRVSVSAVAKALSSGKVGELVTVAVEYADGRPLSAKLIRDHEGKLMGVIQ